MSIRDKAAEGKEQQEAERTQRRAIEAKARPDALHRAVVFLIKQAVMNNRDASDEGAYLIRQLDNTMAGDPEALAEVEPPPVAQPAESAGNPPPAPPATIARSRRFKRNT